MGFRVALRHEMSVCFRGRCFIAAMTIAVGLAVAAGAECVVRESYWHTLDSFYLSNHSAYAAWIVANCSLGTVPTVFFYLLPLLVTVPFAWSFRSERMSGYDIQIMHRVGRSKRMAAKAIAVFCSAALVATAAHVVNFIVVSSWLPLYIPAFEDVNVLGIFTESFFSNLFYSKPLGYVAAYTLLNSALMGVWAVLVLSASAVFKNRVSLMLVPYLVLLGVRYLNTWLASVSLLYMPCFNLIDNMQGTYWDVRPDPIVLSFEVALMLCLSVLLCRRLTRADVA